jgi:hypothetical protein
VPLLVFFLGPIDRSPPVGAPTPPAEPGRAHRPHLPFIVRPIAVGGMLVGACFTLYKMRKNLIARHQARRGRREEVGRADEAPTVRTERDLSLQDRADRHRRVFVLMVALYFYFTGASSAAPSWRRRHAGHRASSSPRCRATWSA